MNLSAKTEYACLALLELALQSGSPEPVRVREIADRHGIPSRFLVQILLQLKGAGFVVSIRGASGGYRLHRDPQEITLGDIVGVIEGGGEIVSNVGNETPMSRALLGIWREANEAQQQRLASVTLADLVQKVQGETNNMYYI